MKLVVWFVVVLCAVVIGAGVGLSVFLGPDDLKKCLANESCEPADAVVVISGGDTNARVDEAVRLYKAGVAAKILMSGAAADKNGPSNAVVMRNHALELGVSLSDIILEDQAANTRQNAEFSQKIVAENGWRRVVLVTSAYHQRRAGMEFRRALGGEVVVYDHPTNSDRSWGAVWWLTPVGWWLALSELTGIVWFNVR